MQAPPPEQGYAPPKKPSYLWLWILLGALVVCGCGGFLVLGAVLFPVFSQARRQATRTWCISNVKQLATASAMYSADFDDRLPPSASWSEGLSGYAKNPALFTCPAVGGRNRNGPPGYGYAVNQALGSKPVKTISSPGTTIWLYETAVLKPNAAGDPAKEPTPDRHGKGRTEAYVDGSAKFVRATGP